MNATHLLNSLSRRTVILLAGIWLSGCTTLLATNSIEPYTKNKARRNAIEQAAEEFCLKKRAVAVNAYDSPLPDYLFTTDGCSRWFDKSWLTCCVLHDITYWCGGSEEDRNEADIILRHCVQKKAGVMGSIMYTGVRIGGPPWLPTPWRWGYGWEEWPRSYEKLQKSSSLETILKKLKTHEIIENHFRDMKYSE